MKNLWILVLCAVTLYGQKTFAQQQPLEGAYLLEQDSTKSLWLFQDGYASHIAYTDRAYIATFGGSFTYDGETVRLHCEYDDADSAQVGRTRNINLRIADQNLSNPDGKSWVRQQPKPQDLDGLWRITSRKQDSTMRAMKRSDRKTIKLLVDGYFQWMAINPVVKGFYGTGGGIYTFVDGQYTEHILFFSRDDSRIGIPLKFDGKIEDGEWHHSGLSSKGEEIHEVWSPDGQ